MMSNDIEHCFEFNYTRDVVGHYDIYLLC